MVERASEPIEAEFAFPDWVFGLSNYAFAADGTIVAVGRAGGRDRLVPDRSRRGGHRRSTCRSPRSATSPIDGGIGGLPSRRARSAVGGRSSSTSRRGATTSLSRSTHARARSRGRLARRAGRLPDRRRPDGVRDPLPTDQQDVPRPGRRPPAAHRHEPRRADRPGLDRVRRPDPAVHEPRLRRSRRGLRRLDRVRQGVPQAPRRRVGRRGPRRLRRRRSLARRPRESSTASGSRSGAAAPAATRRSAR